MSSTKPSQIIGLGGGGFAMEDSPLLDDYILAATGRPEPRVCFLATASGDNENYITRFYRAFTRKPCSPRHLELFRRGDDVREVLLAQDAIYVGGGNTVNMLAIWKLHGVDQALRDAYHRGVVLAGMSAGSVCWFEQGVTDSFGDPLQPCTGLGILEGSHCPHYDGEPGRRVDYERWVGEGSIKPGIAADDGVALHYTDGELAHVVASRAGAQAYAVTREGETSNVRTIAPRVLS